MWKPLFDLKFYRYADHVSAAWIWTRIKRIGRSRRSLFAEELGYIDGGSQTLVDALIAALRRNGGSVLLSCPAWKVQTQDGRVTGVLTPQGVLPADAVISTVPTPLVRDLAPDLPADWLAKYDAIDNIGVCCLLFKLKRSVTPHFWVNVSEPDIPIPGFIEFSNLRPVDDKIVYVPYYMPTDHPKFTWPDQRLLDEAFACLRRVNPALSAADIVHPTSRGCGMRSLSASLVSPRRFRPSKPRLMGFKSPTHVFITPRIVEFPRAFGLAKRWRRGCDFANCSSEVGSERVPAISEFCPVAGGLAALVNLSSRYVLSSILQYEIAVAIAVSFRHDDRVSSHSAICLRGERTAHGSRIWSVRLGQCSWLYPSLDRQRRSSPRGVSQIRFDWHAEEIAHLVGMVSPIAVSYYGNKHFSFKRAEPRPDVAITIEASAQIQARNGVRRRCTYTNGGIVHCGLCLAIPIKAASMENFDDLASAKSQRIEELLDHDIALPLVIDLDGTLIATDALHRVPGLLLETALARRMEDSFLDFFRAGDREKPIGESGDAG